MEDKNTNIVYGFLWSKSEINLLKHRWHYNDMQDLIPEPIVRGKVGVDIGSGCGYDTYIMAKDNPAIRIISVDLSDGVFKTRELTSGTSNVNILKSSVLDMPIKNDIFDFAYSFGVLHHVSNPKKGLLEIRRILKKDCPAFLYFYEDHSNNRIKYTAIRMVSLLRGITTKMQPVFLYALCWLLSPVVFMIFTMSSKAFRGFNGTKRFADMMPFNFGTDPFSLRADLYDRFRAPVEHRFNKMAIYEIFDCCGFKNVKIVKFKDRAGLVVWGYKR